MSTDYDAEIMSPEITQTSLQCQHLKTSLLSTSYSSLGCVPQKTTMIL